MRNSVLQHGMRSDGARRDEDAPLDQSRLPRSAIWLALSLFFAIAATNLLTPLLPTIIADFHADYSAAGVLVTAFILARLVASATCDRIVERVGRNLVAVGSLIGIVVGSLIGLFAWSFEVLLISRVVAGVGMGYVSTVSLAALSEVATPRRRGQIMSVFQIANNAGIAAYPLIGGIVGTAAGWRATFVVMALGAVASAALLLPALIRIPAEGDRTSSVSCEERTAKRRRDVTLWTAYAGVFACFFNRHGFRNTLLPLYAAAVLGLGPVAISTGIGVMSLVGLLVSMPGAMAGDRFGHRRVIAVGLIALGIGDLTFLATGDYLLFVLASAAVGLGDFFIGSQTALISGVAPPEERTRAMGRFRVTTDVGALLGPLVLASVMEHVGPPAAMLLAASLLIAAGVLSRVAILTEGDSEDETRVSAPTPVT